MTPDMYSRISAGIDFLNEQFGSIHAWINEIDLEMLNMHSLEYCVIAQLYGSYCYELWNTDARIGYSGHPYGFDDEQEEYAELTAAWIAVISGLRSTLN